MTAKENTRANNVYPRVFCDRAVGFQHRKLRQVGSFDLILANILARPLRRLAPQMAKHSSKDGYIILSGILKSQYQSVENTYEGWGMIAVKRFHLANG